MHQSNIQGIALIVYGTKKLCRIKGGKRSVGERHVKIKTIANNMRRHISAGFEKNQIPAPATAIIYVGDSAL